ncbi:MAG: peptidoglycan-binding protein [Clostridia bacterium]|nr:peptidoglycan-binding protein [Clostridia bacterium]
MHQHIRKAVALLACLALLLSCSPAFAYTIQPTNVKRIITLDRGASFRSTPSNEGANNKICGIHAGTELEVLGKVEVWYYVYYAGQYGFVSSGAKYTRVLEYQSNPTDVPRPTSRTAPQTTPRPANRSSQGPGGSYDMGVPQIGNASYGNGEMNMAVFWVQTQMKATGIWYQGEIWDCTGNLGDHTADEIRDFMRSRGYGAHSGRVDQLVIDELAAYLGNRVVPVYVGGMYDYMDAIMIGGSTGSMYPIVSNLRDGIPHVTTGARWVQVCLKKLGYYEYDVDGMYGEGTERAVMAFQRSYSWQERDYVSLGVARAMLEAYYYADGSLYTLP